MVAQKASGFVIHSLFNYTRLAITGVTKQGILKGKYHCTIDLLFDQNGISCMTTDNFLFLFAKQTNPNLSNSRSAVQ
jgi:hypothetical protein